MAALHFHGWEDAITNFAPSQYTKEMVQQHLERLEKKDYKIPPDLLASCPKFHRDLCCVSSSRVRAFLKCIVIIFFAHKESPNLH
jgi:hypothetical protein